MKRRDFLSGLFAAAASSGAAQAKDFASSVIDQLRAQGYGSVEQERTLLGRVRITATRSDGQREIIINPKTGEILRDLWTPAKGGVAAVKIIGDDSGRTDDDNDSSHGGDDSDGDDDHDGDGGGKDTGGDSDDDNDQGGGGDGEGGGGNSGEGGGSHDSGGGDKGDD